MIRHDQELYYIGPQAVEEPQKWLKWYDTTDNATGEGWLPYLLHISNNTLTSMSSNVLSHFSLTLVSLYVLADTRVINVALPQTH